MSTKIVVTEQEEEISYKERVAQLRAWIKSDPQASSKWKYAGHGSFVFDLDANNRYFFGLADDGIRREYDLSINTALLSDEITLLLDLSFESVEIDEYDVERALRNPELFLVATTEQQLKDAQQLLQQCIKKIKLYGFRTLALDTDTTDLKQAELTNGIETMKLRVDYDANEGLVLLYGSTGQGGGYGRPVESVEQFTKAIRKLIAGIED